ncbi:PrgI family protein [Candidatus Uhrbacteria bacterium]|nr:PrgI family protein [Candidatus Uhrbacteria bacterium]
MDQITVPQFIENEDRILGPITARQFVILLVAAGMIYVAYKTSDLTLFVIMAIIIGGVAATLAFYRVNGQPFHFFLLNIIRTASRPSLRVWKKEARHVRHAKETKEEREAPLPPERPRALVGSHRLSDLALIVDTGGAYRQDVTRNS